MILDLLSALCLLIIPALAGFAQTKDDPAVVGVELVLRGPDGHLVENKTVEITILGQSNPPGPAVTATSDGQGVVRCKVPIGRLRLGVKVPGVGYGNTGATEFTLGAVAHPDLPPLAGFGSMDGFVPRNVCRGQVTVSAWSPYVGSLTAEADSTGRFHLADVPGGDWFLTAFLGKGTDCMCALGPTVFVNVGEFLKDISVTALKSNPCWAPAPATASPPAPPAEPKTSASMKVGHAIKTDPPIVWARGIVKDDSGRPVENATVFALATYYGGIRMMEAVAKAQTDANGYYELKGANGLSNFSATLLATAPGHPPAWAWPAFPQISWFDSDPPVPEAITQDLVLPSKSSQLSVTVLREGKPAAGASVAVYLENANLRDVWAMGARGGVREEIENAAHPAGVTDANGRVRFDNLLPGRYSVYCLASSKTEDIRGFTIFPQAGRGIPSGVASGIPVRAGETANHTLNLYEQRNTVSFRVLRPDGEPLTGNTPFQFGPVDTIQWSSSIALDANGQGQWDLQHGGLWQIRFIRKDTSSANGVRAPDDFREPYNLANAFVAVSPNIPNGSIPDIRGRPVEPPSARAVLQDSQGAPVHATVTLIQKPNEIIFGTGSSDKNGEIFFAGLVTGQEYVVHVSGTELARIETVNWDADIQPIPLNQLKTQYAFADQRFVPAAESMEKLVFQPQPLRYVYGVIRHKPGTEIENTHLDRPEHGFQTFFWLRASTGEFVAGPFLPGTAMLYFQTANPRQEFAIPVEVRPGHEEPVHFDIDTEKLAADGSGETGITGTPHSFLGMGGISTQTTGAQHLVGNVFLSDGVTPAVGAQVIYFQAGRNSPAIFAMTDALGELHPRGLWSGPVGASGDNSPLPSPVLVAVLPGERGATIYKRPIRRDQALRITLPPAISASGSVTVGGRNPSQRPGVIHILAAYQDQGALNSALSVSTTADAEGSFSLAGLTPGTYLVQAALDDIWLSSVATLHVSGEKSEPIQLAIPSPGAPVTLELRDHSGKPSVGHSVTIERAGPLAYLWPRELRSDGAGLIYFPTLEAGRQTIRVNGESKPLKFKVPALPASPIEVKAQTAF